MSWKTLGAVAPCELVDTRLQLHHAAQVVAAVGRSLLVPQPDDSHPNLGWAEGSGALVGRSIPGVEIKVGLRVAEGSLVLLDAKDDVADEFALEGKTVDDGYAWLESAITGAGVKLPEAGLSRSGYEIPDHGVGNGAPFSTLSTGSGVDAAAELACWLSNASEVLEQSAARTPGASEVRCWPHHLDIASLVVVESHADGSLAKSIGIGLSPGDETYAEPYWYVSPWPYPKVVGLGGLASGGRWHDEGYTAAVLSGSALVDGLSGGQSDRLHAFLDSAMQASRCALAD